MKKSTGFDFVEILVVFSVALFLCSLVAVTFHSVRERQRDTYRMALLQKYAEALNLYYDNTGHYPVNSQSLWSASCWVGDTGNWISDNGNYNWSTAYLSIQPHDPLESCVWPFTATDAVSTGAFGYWSDGAQFALVTLLENSGDIHTIAHTRSLWVDGKTDVYTQAGWYGRTFMITSKKH